MYCLVHSGAFAASVGCSFLLLGGCLLILLWVPGSTLGDGILRFRWHSKVQVAQTSLPLQPASWLDPLDKSRSRCQEVRDIREVHERCLQAVPIQVVPSRSWRCFWRVVCLVCRRYKVFTRSQFDCWWASPGRMLQGRWSGSGSHLHSYHRWQTSSHRFPSVTDSVDCGAIHPLSDHVLSPISILRLEVKAVSDVSQRPGTDRYGVLLNQ